uniref:Uncharacterized protein n=1 Tax=Anguilla anguilla TaxID=7936 RepID=A0A0E9XQW0_ANGAN
MLLNPKKRKN